MAGFVAASVPLLATGQAAAATATCPMASPVYDVKANGNLWLYQDALGGSSSGSNWVGIHQIGSGWQGRTLPGAGGDLFSITPTGDLRHLHYDVATGTWANNGGYTTIGHGFGRYLQDTLGAGLITVDAQNHIFVVDGQGDLRSFTYSSTTGQLDSATGDLVDSGWGKYDRIFSGGPGVLYAVDVYGQLYRYRYDQATQEFTEYADAVGSDWGNVADVWSTGGDMIYATQTSGSLLKFHFNDDTQTWDNGGHGTPVGSGWTTDILDSGAQSDACSVPAPAPVAPTTPVAATPADALKLGTPAPGTSPYYYYLDGGRLEQAQDSSATGLSGPTRVGTQTFAGPASVTDPTGEIAVAGVDSTGTAYLGQAADHPPTTLSSVGGSVKSVGVTTVDDDVQLFGVGANGDIWGRTQVRPGNELTAWRDLSRTYLDGPDTLTGPLAVASSGGDDAYGVGTLANGATEEFTYQDGSFGYGPVTGSAGYGLPAVTDRAATPTLFAISTSTGQVATNTESDRDWVALPALPAGVHAATGSVSSTVAGGNGIAVTVLGSDGLVYATNQTGSGSSTYLPWQRVGASRSATAPTLFSRNGSGVDLAFKGTDGKIYHYTAPAPAAGAPLVLTGGGHSFG